MFSEGCVYITTCVHILELNALFREAILTSVGVLGGLLCILWQLPMYPYWRGFQECSITIDTCAILCSPDESKSSAHTTIDGPDSVPNGDQTRTGNTPVQVEEYGSTKEDEKSCDSVVQVEAKAAGTPSSSVTSQMAPSPASSAPPTQPVIPPRPYRPPRPFPPPSASQAPSSSSSKHQKRITHHGDPRCVTEPRHDLCVYGL